MAIGVGIPLDASGLTVNIGNYSTGTLLSTQDNLVGGDSPLNIPANAVSITIHNTGLVDITVTYNAVSETIKPNDQFKRQAFSDPSDQTLYRCAETTVTLPAGNSASAPVNVERTS